jgi:hypothetical protein
VLPALIAIAVTGLTVRLPEVTLKTPVVVMVRPAVALAKVTLLPLTLRLAMLGLVLRVTVYEPATAKLAVSPEAGGLLPTPPVQWLSFQLPLVAGFQLTVAARALLVSNQAPTAVLRKRQ